LSSSSSFFPSSSQKRATREVQDIALSRGKNGKTRAYVYGSPDSRDVIACYAFRTAPNESQGRLFSWGMPERGEKQPRETYITANGKITGHVISFYARGCTRECSSHYYHPLKVSLSFSLSLSSSNGGDPRIWIFNLESDVTRSSRSSAGDIARIISLLTNRDGAVHVARQDRRTPLPINK